MTPVEIVARAMCAAQGRRFDDVTMGSASFSNEGGYKSEIHRRVGADYTGPAQAVLDALTAAGWRPPIEVPESVKDAMGRGLSEWSGIRDRDIEEAVELALEGLAGGGFVVVPRQATEAMQEAGSPWKYQLDCVWSAMIAASQSTEQQP